MRIINLLPKPRQQEMRLQRILHSLNVFVALSVFTYALVFAAQFFTHIYLQNQAGSITDEISSLKQQVDKQENATIKQNITVINDTVNDFQNLANGAPYWSKAVIAFAKLPPPGVTIMSFTANRDTGAVNITGTAPTRDLVIQMYNNVLADSAEFYNIDYPLENIARPTNISFHYSFYMRDSLMK